MKVAYGILWVILLLMLAGCQSPTAPPTGEEDVNIRQEVTAQFKGLVDAVNRIDSQAWADYYSVDEYVSAFVSTDYYGTRREWVDTITRYFAQREFQHMDIQEIRVIPFTTELALMTSREKTEMRVIGGETGMFRHGFTMLWKKEPAGWKIIHSHESVTEEPAGPAFDRQPDR
ncbi:MAG: nuclear transport factor 2 family protein [Acidobacteria bacterium]|nr:nuclear transport factor 2 family protein [Acidobacteriota bacterium]